MAQVAGDRDPLSLTFFALVVVWVVAMPLSVAVSEIALWTGVAIWCVGWFRRELAGGDVPVPEPADRGPAGDLFSLIGTPLMAFWGVSVVSALVSRDPVESIWSLREVFLFAAPLLTYVALRRPVTRYFVVMMFTIGIAVSVGLGLLQTIAAAGGAGGPETFRPSGALGHYMTYAGSLMIAIPAMLVERRGWRALVHRVVVMAALVVIGLTMTRSAWIGTAVGFLVYLACGRVSGRAADSSGPTKRWAGYGVTVVVLVVLGVIGLLALAGPETLYERGTSIFSVDNATNLDRLAMAAAGIRIIQEHPMLGIGPGLMARVYPAWRVEWAVNENNSHLHNNALQIAAERGLLALALWLWLMAAFVVGAWRVLRHAGPFGEGGPEARAALTALAAFLVMGLFEYNFSDSEVLMLLLFVSALPFAASAGLGADHAATGDDLARGSQ